MQNPVTKQDTFSSVIFITFLKIQPAQKSSRTLGIKRCKNVRTGLIWSVKTPIPLVPKMPKHCRKLQIPKTVPMTAPPMGSEGNCRNGNRNNGQRN